jgi:phytoene synthase
VAGGTASPADTTQILAASAREGEADRYLGALLAPPPAREALLALAAFAAEVGRVPLLVTRETAMGEIRLQWWRDALELPEGLRTGHPVADSLRAAVHRHALPRALLLDVIEARSLDLHGEANVDDEALRTYLWKSEGTLFALAAGVLADAAEPNVGAAAAASGHAYGLARLLLGLPNALSRGRLALPRTRLAAAGVTGEDLLLQGADGGVSVAPLLADLRAASGGSLVTARQHVANLPRRMRVAFLPLALVASYLRALERQTGDRLREEAQIAPLTRVLRIAGAHWLGRF